MIEWFKVMAKAAIGEIYIYGDIDDEQWWGTEITPQTIKDELDKIKDVDSVKIYFNSYGGSVFAGAAIYHELKRIEQPTESIVDGVAASIASLIVLAANKVVMPVNAMLMIHRASMRVCGTAKKLRDGADSLAKIEDNVIVTAYQDKTGLEKETLLAMMDKDTWMGGVEAVELGFADEVLEDQKIAARYVGDNVKFNDLEIPLDKFKTFPKDKFTEHTPNKSTSLKQRHRHTINMLSA